MGWSADTNTKPPAEGLQAILMYCAWEALMFTSNYTLYM